MAKHHRTTGAQPTGRAADPLRAAPARRHGAATLALLCAAQFMIVLDASIVIVALPSIQSSLALNVTTLPWVMNTYLLVFAGFLLLGGRLADRLGRRRVFLAGVALFSGASVLCGLAPNAAALVAARAVQGLGGAVAVPAALSLLAVSFTEGSERNRALAIWGAVAGSGGAAGVLLGGLITDLLSWPWIFFVNVPIGAAVVVLAPRLLPSGRPQPAAGRRGVDLPGALTVTAGLALLVYALVTSADHGWGSAQTLGCLIGAAALLAGFVVLEHRAVDPMVPLAAFRRRSVSAANAVSLLFSASVISLFLMLSLYMQRVLGYTPLATGVACLAATLVMIASATRVHGLVNRFGLVRVLAAGLVLSVAARLWFAQAGVHSSYPITLLPGLLLAGVGMGLTFVPVTIAAVSGASSQHAGILAGLLNTCQQVGGALGVAVLSTVAAAHTNGFLHAHPAGPARLPRALVSGFDAAFLTAAALAAAALLVTVRVLRRDPVAASPVPATTTVVSHRKTTTPHTIGSAAPRRPPCAPAKEAAHST